MSFGSSAPAGASTNQPKQGASVYTPTAQGPADIAFQNVGSGFLGALGPLFQGMTGFPSNQTANAFAGTPGGQAYQAAQEWLGPGSITDYTNPYYQQALGSTAMAAGFAPQVENIAGTIAGAAPGAYQVASGAAQPAIGGLESAINYGYGGAIPQAIANAQGLYGDISQFQGGLSSLLGETLPQVQGASGALLSDVLSGIGRAFPQAQTGGGSLMTSGQDILNNVYPLARQIGTDLTGASNVALKDVFPQAMGASNALYGAGNQILNTGFDPQQALYDRTQNQVAQQAAAQAAQAGLGGTAYGASVDANALGNFNINWQNQQLARQAQAEQAAGQAFGTAGQLPGQAISSTLPGFQAGLQFPGQTAASAIAPMQAGAALPGATLSSFDQPLTTAAGLPGGVLQQGGAIGQNIAALSQAAGALPLNLAAGYGGLGTQAGQLAYSPLQGYAGLGGQISPLAQQGATLGTGLYNLGAQGTSNALQTLGSGVNLGNQQFTIPQQVLQDIESYMGLGQSASQLSGYLGNLGLQQQQNAFSGLGSALGTGANLLFGNQPFGSSGLLGNPFSSSSGGLLGGSLANMFGGGLGNTAQYFTPLTGTLGGDATFGGGADFAGSALAGGAGLGLTDAGAAAGGGGFFDTLGGLAPLLGGL